MIVGKVIFRSHSHFKCRLLSFFVRGNRYPDEITRADDEGYTMLHHEAIAGNLTRLELLLAKGADKNAKNIHGKTALDYARALGWDHVAEALSR